ncbi:MAG: RNA-directed DNA polymerase, partial [Myxococcota bacterium]
TSPALANLVAFRMDARLAGFAEAWGAHYSRYADDLTFSGGGALRGGRFLGGVTDIVEAEGFTVRTNKTLCMGQGRRQTVTGLVVNEQVALPRRRFDRLKAILHQCALDGPDAHNREQHPDFRAHLLGQISFAEMVDPARGAKLRARFERISWD